MAPGAAAFSYSHGIVSSGLSWTAVLEEGARFIEALLQHIEHLRVGDGDEPSAYPFADISVIASTLSDSDRFP